MNSHLKLTSMFCTGVAGMGLMLAQAAQTPKQQPAQKVVPRPVQAQEFRSFPFAVADTFGSVAQDLDGDLWIGTRNGVVKLIAQGLMSYGRADGLSDADIASIQEDRQSRLHVVSAGWLISQLDKGKWHPVQHF